MMKDQDSGIDESEDVQILQDIDPGISHDGIRIWKLSALAFAAVMLTSSPLSSGSILTGTGTLDGSWRWALIGAFRTHLQFGREFLFTYGPYGFLDSPGEGPSRSLWFAAVLFGIMTEVLFVVSLYLLASRCRWFSPRSRLGLSFAWGAFTVISIEVMHLAPSVILSATLVLQLLLALQRNPRWRGWVTLSSTLGIALALISLIKVSMFLLAVLILALLPLVGRQRAKNRMVAYVLKLAISVAEFTAGYLIFWLVAGQSLSNLPTYMRGVIQIVVGYGETMSIDGYGYQVIITVVLILAVLGLLLLMVKSSISVSSVVSSLALAGFMMLFWKEGIVRQDPTPTGGHVISAVIGVGFVSLVVAFFSQILTSWRKAASMVVLTMAVGFMAVVSPAAIAQSSPGENLTATGTALAQLSSSSLNADAIQAENQALQSDYMVPSAILSEVGTSKVAILPYNLTIGSAYGLNELLLPVSQLYSAYTPYLDALDARFLLDSRVKYVVVQDLSIDGRYAPFSAPSVFRVLLTHYRVSLDEGGYALYVRSNFPSSTRANGSSDVTLGAWWKVRSCPSGSPILAFSLKQTVVSSLYSEIYREPSAYLLLKTSEGVMGPFRFVWPNSPDGLYLGQYVSSTSTLSNLYGTHSNGVSISAIKVVSPAGMFSTSSPVRLSFRCLVN